MMKSKQFAVLAIVVFVGGIFGGFGSDQIKSIEEAFAKGTDHIQEIDEIIGYDGKIGRFVFSAKGELVDTVLGHVWVIDKDTSSNTYREVIPLQFGNTTRSAIEDLRLRYGLDPLGIRVKKVE